MGNEASIKQTVASANLTSQVNVIDYHQQQMVVDDPISSLEKQSHEPENGSPVVSDQRGAAANEEDAAAIALASKENLKDANGEATLAMESEFPIEHTVVATNLTPQVVHVIDSHHQQRVVDDPNASLKKRTHEPEKGLPVVAVAANEEDEAVMVPASKNKKIKKIQQTIDSHQLNNDNITKPLATSNVQAPTNDAFVVSFECKAALYRLVASHDDKKSIPLSYICDKNCSLFGRKGRERKLTRNAFDYICSLRTTDPAHFWNKAKFYGVDRADYENTTGEPAPVHRRRRITPPKETSLPIASARSAIKSATSVKTPKRFQNFVFDEEYDMDLDRVWQPNSLWAQRTQRVSVKSTNHVVDTIDLMLPVNDYKDGSDFDHVIEAHLIESGTAFAIKMPAVPLFFVNQVAAMHSCMRNKSNNRFKSDHEYAALVLQGGRHFKWVRYNLPDGIECNTDYFNNRDGRLDMEYTMTVKDLPFKDKSGNYIKTFLPFVVFNVAVSGNEKILQCPGAAPVDQLAEAFNHIVDKI